MKTKSAELTDAAGSQKLLTRLLAADAEDEVIAILKGVGLWDDTAAWRLYGDQEDNFSPAGAQQSNAEAALVEKAINAVDAALMGHALAAGIDPRSSGAPQSPREAVAIFYESADPAAIPESLGTMANWTPAKRTQAARNITIALTGKRGRKPCVSIADAGEGQAPEALPTTILSLLHGNKKSIPFVQGKFNMGGTGALRFCGYHNLQLVLSKRHPDIASREGASKAWGFTVVRRENPSAATRVSTYRYLAPVGAAETPGRGEVLRFEADDLPIFPVGQDPYGRPARWGTLLKLYEYDTRRDGHFFMKGGLLQRLDMMMPGLMLPIRLHECRGFRGDERSFETTLTGLEVRLRAQEADTKAGGNLEAGFPDSGSISVGGETLAYTIYAFRRADGPGKSDRHESYKTTEGILYVVNGQTHAIKSHAFFTRPNVGLGYVAKSLLVVLDCTGLDARTKEDLFMNSRDRLADARLARRIEEQLADLLRRHAGLQDLKNRRRQEDTASRVGDSKPVEEVLRSMLKRSPALARLFFPGSRLSNPFSTVDVPVGKKFEGKLHPTYFRFRDREAGIKLERTAHLKQRARLTFETDVVNDYLRRSYRPGHIRLTARLNDAAVAIDSNTNLYDGFAHVNLDLPDEAKEGDTLQVRVEIEDETLVEPFVNEAVLRVAREMIQQRTAPGPRKRRPDAEPEGDTEKRPAGISIPEPTPVHKDEWEKHGMDRFSAMRAIIGEAVAEGESPGIGAYDLFINMDNDYLRAEQKAHAKNAQMIQYRYKFGMTLAAITAIRYATDRQTTAAQTAPDSEEGEGPSWTPEQLVAAATDALAPALLPMVDILGDLDDEDLQQMAEAASDGDAAEDAA